MVEIGVRHAEATELRRAPLNIPAAPAHDLQVSLQLICLGETHRRQPLPKRRVADADDGEVCLVINPLDAAVVPFAATAFLQSNQCAVGQALGGCQYFVALDDGSKLGCGLRPLIPRDAEVEVITRDVKSNDARLPVRLGGVLTENSGGRREDAGG